VLKLNSPNNRRQFLSGVVGLSLNTFLPRPPNAQIAGPQSSAVSDDALFTVLPTDTLLKFNPDGSPRHFAGNTVICHLPQQSRGRDAVVALGDALRSSPCAAKLGILPGDSYHITILGGLNDQVRSGHSWPSDLPLDTPIRKCNHIIGERIKRFQIHADLPIRFRLDPEKTLAFQRASGIQVVPADLHEKAKLRTIRNRLADEVFHYRADDHATFGFHISLAYQLRPFTSEERQHYQDLLEEHVRSIDSAYQVIELSMPELCTFKDMYRFEIQQFLRS